MVKNAVNPWTVCLYNSRQKAKLEEDDFQHERRIPFVHSSLSILFGLSAVALNSATNHMLLDSASYVFTSISLVFTYCASASIKDLEVSKLKRSCAKNTP